MELKFIKILFICLTLIGGQIIADQKPKSYFEQDMEAVKNVVRHPVSVGVLGLGTIVGCFYTALKIRPYINWDNQSNSVKGTVGLLAITFLVDVVCRRWFIPYTKDYYFVEGLKTDKNNGKTTALDLFCKASFDMKNSEFVESLRQSGTKDSKMALTILNNYVKYYLDLPEDSYRSEVHNYFLFKDEIKKYLTEEQKELYNQYFFKLISPRDLFEECPRSDYVRNIKDFQI